MFPIEMYAPKSDIAINGMGSPDIVGAVGNKTVVTKKPTNPKIDKLIIKLGEEVAAQNLLEEEKIEKIETKIEQLPDQSQEQYKQIETNTEELEREISPQNNSNLNNKKNLALERKVEETEAKDEQYTPLEASKEELEQEIISHNISYIENKENNASETKITQSPEQLDEMYKIVEINVEELERQIVSQNDSKINNKKSLEKPELPYFDHHELSQMSRDIKQSQ